MAHVTRPSTQKTRGKVLHAVLAQGAALSDPAKKADHRVGLSKKEFWRRAAIDPDNGRQGLRDLLDEGKLEQTLRLSRNVGSILAISIGTESARGALVDPNGTMYCAFESPPLPDQLTELSRTLLLNRVAVLAYTILEAGVKASPGEQIPLIGVSVAWPSPLDAVTKHPSVRVLRHHQWRREPIPVTKAVAERLQWPDWAGSVGAGFMRSHAINDANAVAVSAAFTKVRERAVDPDDGRSGPLLVIRAGGGIGAGIVLLANHRGHRSAFLDSYLIEGRGFAGEIAHLPISAADVDELGQGGDGLIPLTASKNCACGRETCLESVASAHAVVNRVRESGLLADATAERHRNTDALRLIGRNAPKNKAFSRALYQAGSLIGRSLAGPIMLLGPRQITLSGSLAESALIEGLEDRRKDWQYIQKEPGPEVRVLRGRENRLAAARGAALVVLREQLYRRFDEPKTLDVVAEPYERRHLLKLKTTLTREEENKPVPIDEDL